jgi:hypothetical protein
MGKALPEISELKDDPTHVDPSKNVSLIMCPDLVSCAAPGSAPTLCVHRNTPEALLSFFLAADACPLMSMGSISKSAHTAWWTFSCFSEQQLQHLAALLANSSSEWAPPGHSYSEQNVAAAIRDMASSESFCREAGKDGCLLPLMDLQLPAFNATCAAAGILHKLDSCCRNEPLLPLPARNLTGTLPPNFHPAREYTDLSYNPNLCGVIRDLPLPRAGLQQTVRVLNNTSPFINLYNSNVKLDLPALASRDRTIGPQVAYWLGVGFQGQPVLAYNNLQGQLPAAQSIHVCSLLAQGQLHGFIRAPICTDSNSLQVQEGSVQTKDGNGGQGTRGGCNCTSRNVIEDLLRHHKVGALQLWAACHPEQLYLSFPNSIQQFRAQLHYNAYAEQHDEAVSCGATGWRYRQLGVGLIWGITLPGALLGFALYHRFKDKVKARIQGSRTRFSGALGRVVSCLALVGALLFSPLAQLLGKLSLCYFDVIMDAIFVADLGGFGNLQGVVMLGWPILISGSLAYWVSLARAWYRYGGRRPGTSLQWAGYVGLSLVFGGIALGCLVAIVLAALVHSYLLSQAGGYQVLLLGDAWVLALLFIVPGAVAQGLAGSYGVFWRVNTELQNDAPTGWDTFSWDAVGFLLEDVPQGVLQAYLWLTGMALVPTHVYALSAVGTAVSIAHNSLLLWPAVEDPIGKLWSRTKQKAKRAFQRHQAWVGRSPPPPPPAPPPPPPPQGFQGLVSWLFGLQVVQSSNGGLA